MCPSSSRPVLQKSEEKGEEKKGSDNRRQTARKSGEKERKKKKKTAIHRYRWPADRRGTARRALDKDVVNMPQPHFIHKYLSSFLSIEIDRPPAAAPSPTSVDTCASPTKEGHFEVEIQRKFSKSHNRELAAV